MSEVSVKQFADELGVLPTELLKQLQAAGVNKYLSTDTLTEKDKTILLEYLREIHGGAKNEKNRIKLLQMPTSSVEKPNNSKVRRIRVEVRTNLVVIEAPKCLSDGEPRKLLTVEPATPSALPLFQNVISHKVAKESLNQNAIAAEDAQKLQLDSFSASSEGLERPGETNGGLAEIGHYLSQIRQRAGITQVELARKITWTPAVLSSVEAGERVLASEELQTILEAIGTSEATTFSTNLARTWSVLPRPPLDHPDQDLLWTAEEVAKDLVLLREQPDVRHAFERRLSEYVTEIQEAAGSLLKREHQVSFIGSIGIGKSTAICRLAGLEIPSEEGGQSIPVLEAGAGGVTICEVHLRTGPSYGLIVEPRKDEEIRAHVTDFAEHILEKHTYISDNNDGGNRDFQGISKEIERALRNLAGLKIRREKGADGKTIRRDEAKELGQQLNSVREFVVDVLARMELHRRDRYDIWYDSSTGKSPMAWLKEIFEEVNNGRHHDFTLPKKIEVIVPYALLPESDLFVRIIDTKGIDRTSARADLEVHLDEPHTLAVLCSGFNNAPAAEPRLLLERAKEAGVRTFELNTSLLVLPRPNEALAVKDESGIRVVSVEEGYELKGEQIEMALEPLGSFAVGFFNSYEDDPERLREFLIERLINVRETFRLRIHETTNNARALLLNHKKEQVQAVIRQATKMLQSWATENTEVAVPNAHVQDSLMEQMTRAYASTIRAAVRREGVWPNLDYSHQLGHGARRMATKSLGRAVEGFTEFCKILARNPDFTEAQDLIKQAEHVLRSSYEALLRKVQLMAQASFRDELKLDTGFWLACNHEWGRGSGYRDRVAKRNEVWFKDTPCQTLEKELRILIEREWTQTLARVTNLFERE